MWHGQYFIKSEIHRPITIESYTEEADLLDDTEKVDVGVVDGKVEEDGARAPVDPEVLFEVGHDGDSLGLGGGKVLDVASPAVRRDLS